LFVFINIQAYVSLTLETIAFRKGTIKTHTTINKQFTVDLNIPPKAERDLSIRTMMLERHFTVTTPGANHIEYRGSLQNTIDNISSETITCYTDRSRTDSGSGAGYIITSDNNNTSLEERSLKLPDYCIVYQTELTAIITAIITALPRILYSLNKQRHQYQKRPRMESTVESECFLEI